MRTPLSILLSCLFLGVWASPPKATFTENKGQWPAQVLYRAQIPGGVMFVEKSAFTYVLFSESPLGHHGHAHQPEHPGDGKAHAYRVNFVGGIAETSSGSNEQAHYENHFIGNDPAKWGSGCRIFGEVLLKGVWPGIDVRVSGKDGIKYDFLVAPGADPGMIRLLYDGQLGLGVESGAMRVSLATGDVVEEAPITYQEAQFGLDDRLRHAVDSRYRLNGNIVSFDIDGTIAPEQRLVIDPMLTFASYTGSTADNFGCTATYDASGHLYGGGIVFNAGYPTTLGVYQSVFAGGTIDVGISKWTPDGTALVWSTYLGGAFGADAPHSLVVNEQDELYVMGTTGSSDYPTTAGAYDASFAVGGGPVSWTNIFGGYGYSHNSGCDIFITHFNVGATALVGSTLVGGTGQDGLNNNTSLTHNYGDHFRGEIALDANENPVVATSTFSLNMPTTPGAPQAALGGSQDGYVFRMNPALTNLLWATYIGGPGEDSAFGVQFDSNGNVFVTGGTTSAGLPMPGASADNTQNGGVDGYIMKYSAAGALLSGTYLGTNAYDQSYLVQLDTDDNVYVAGQSHGAYPVTPGKYTNANSSQFIHKFNNTLSASLWSTVIGNGNLAQDVSPTAFLVSDCGQVYFTGWAGTTNGNAGNNSSTATGSPTTSDAFQPISTGSDFWLIVLEAEAVGLNYATFFGGPSSAEHVDGGTSRFDKNGTVYHAVCAGCGSQDDFPTTPGAWSNTNNSFNCNLGVFKFDLSQAQAIIGINGPTSICIGDAAQFTNNSVGGTDYDWDFGDNSPNSSAPAPSHVFATDGQFTVTMVLTDSSGCVSSDTASIIITVLPPPVAAVEPVPPICPGASAQLQASGGTSYAWSPATGLTATNIADPVATPAQPTTYTVTVTDQCGSDDADVLVDFFPLTAAAGPDTSVCEGNSVVINATGGVSYAWTPAATLDDASLQAPTATPIANTTYSVTINTVEGCVIIDALDVVVYSDDPQAILQDTVICAGSSVQLIADDADTYSWHPANGISTLDVQDPVVTPTVPTLYIVDLINSCGPLTDSAFVDLVFVTADAWPDTLICPGFPVPLGASGGVSYLWSPAAGLSNDTIADPIATPAASTTYQLVAFDAIGCTDTAWVQVDLQPWPTIIAGDDMVIDYGDVVQLTASGEGVWTWTPTEWLNDSTISSPYVQPEETTTYTVTTVNELGCKNTDMLTVIVTGSLYVPNSFTPNGDGFNDFFFALGKDLRTIELLVFNRWGELIWSTDKLDGRWDGTYQGVASPIDTYVWKVQATELSGKHREDIGHVNLLR
ncbi:MAG: gliding motility-associated C-terminal domain-containing protein [Flavobacteriales bacterium]|nr:gliding motility-associated C-terminal domain-containing protein [Flavobacteriales bacterium]